MSRILREMRVAGQKCTAPRLRKRWLDPNERKKRERAREAEKETV
jgi:hypothetical protein